MDKIIITIENYKGQKLTYSAPEDALIEIWTTKSVKGEHGENITQIGIEMTYPNGIERVEEVYNG